MARGVLVRWRKNVVGQTGVFNKGEVCSWAGLFLLALLLRVIGLDARPPHHDEAIHGHFARELLHRHSYRYDPTYHGPLQYFVLAGLFAIFGENDLVLRLYSTLAGAALVMVPLLVRRVVGGRSALAMGLLLAISPNFLYFSRFARNDVPVVLFTAIALALLWRKRRDPIGGIRGAGLFLGLHAVSKETIYIYGFLWLVAGVICTFWWGWQRSLTWLRDLCHRERKALLLSAGLFVGVCLFFYTAFFSWPADVLFFVRAVSYWYGQHTVQRVAGPWYFHLPRLVLYDFLILVLAACGLWRRRRRLLPVEQFSLVWGLCSLAMYSYLGEKVPWLSVHQLLPWVPLAGVELGYLVAVRGKHLAKAAATAAVGATAWSALASSFLYPTIEPSKPQAELLVFVQTTVNEQRVAAEGLELGKKVSDKIVASVQGEGAWPLSWQWRDLRVQWGFPKLSQLPPLVIADPGQEVFSVLGTGNYLCEVLPLRAWWVETWSGVGPKELIRWFLTRRAWSPRGSTDIQVCRLSTKPK